MFKKIKAFFKNLDIEIAIDDLIETEEFQNLIKTEEWKKLESLTDEIVIQTGTDEILIYAEQKKECA